MSDTLSPPVYRCRRTTADKRRELEAILTAQLAEQISTAQLAFRAGVSHAFALKIHREFEQVISTDPAVNRNYCRGRDGKVYPRNIRRPGSCVGA